MLHIYIYIYVQIDMDVHLRASAGFVDVYGFVDGSMETYDRRFISAH